MKLIVYLATLGLVAWLTLLLLNGNLGHILEWGNQWGPLIFVCSMGLVVLVFVSPLVWAVVGKVRGRAPDV